MAAKGKGKDRWGEDSDYDGSSPDVDDENLIAELQKEAKDELERE